jgi:protein involved in polysaccharide export with SLBB domain
VPPELLGLPREELKTIPLTLLRQQPPKAYLLAPNDILGIWIEGILGEANVPPPVRFSEQPGLPAAIGFPFPVRDDGTVNLPRVPPVRVEGMTIPQALDAIQKAYVAEQQLRPEAAGRIIVTLYRPRLYHIQVVREDSGGITLTPGGGFSSTKRGTGYVLDLPAYENDVLTALTRTGGLPGLDALNEVIIQRGAMQARADWPAVMPDLGPQSQRGPQCLAAAGMGAAGRITRIPLRLRPGEPIPFQREDVILQSGDIVFIQARDTELFYTMGLIGSGQFILPRDYDLDVVEAIAFARGPLINGAVNQNNFTGTTINSGIGTASPSQVSIVRRVPESVRGQQVVIRVDLNRALRDPRERILIQPGDIIVLQETVGEAIVRYFTNQIHLNISGILSTSREFTTTYNSSFP